MQLSDGIHEFADGSSLAGKGIVRVPGVAAIARVEAALTVGGSLVAVRTSKWTNPGN